MARHREHEIISMLEGNGLPWQSYFVLNKAMVAFRGRGGEIMSLIIEDDQLNTETCKFLERQGLVLNEDLP